MERKGNTSIAKQGAILASAALVVRFIGFLYRVPLLDLIGDEGNLYYSAAYQIYNLFFVISSYGIPIALSKMISERVEYKDYANAKQAFHVALVFCTILGAIGTLIVLFGSNAIASIYKMPNMIPSLRALAPTLIIVSIMSALRGLFQGLNNMKPTAISQLFEQIFNAVFSVILAYVLIGKGIEYGAAGGTLGTGIGALGGLLFMIFVFSIYKKRSRIFNAKGSYTEDRKEVLSILIRTIIPIVLTTVVFSIVNTMDTIMLQNLLIWRGYDPKEVDFLNSLYTGKYILLTNLPISISTAFASASVPSISRSNIMKEKKQVAMKTSSAIHITMLIAFPSAIGLSVLGGHVLQLLFPKFPAGGSLLTIGAYSVIFFSLLQICAGILQGVNRIMVPAKNAFYAGVLKVILNFLLIFVLDLNVYGTVITMVVFSFIVAVLNLKAVVKYTGVQLDYKKVFVKPAISSIIMGLYCYLTYTLVNSLTSSNAVATLLSIILAVFIYFLLLINMNGLDEGDFDSIPYGRFLKVLKVRKG